MDTNVAGLNKVYCFTTSAGHNGKTVSITDGINLWTEVITELGCVFMIPSMPAPAKKRYTVTLHNGDETAAALYERVIDLGFGDSIRIGLYTNDEAADKAYVQSWVASHAYSLPTASSGTKGGITVSDTTSNGLYMSGTGLYLRTASATQKGGVTIGPEFYMNGGILKLSRRDYTLLGPYFNMTVPGSSYVDKDVTISTTSDVIDTFKNKVSDDVSVVNAGILIPEVWSYGYSGTSSFRIRIRFHNPTTNDVTSSSVSCSVSWVYFGAYVS